MQKYIQKIICGLLCIVTTYSLTGCKDGSADVSSSGSASVDSSYTQSQTPDSDESVDSYSASDDSGSNKNDDSSNSGENSTSDSDDGKTEEDPSSDSVIEREAVDGLGHKIVYYTDDTWKDMGRVEPLDFTPRALASRYGYQNLKDGEKVAGKQNLYRQLFNAVLAFSTSGGDVAMEMVEDTACYPIAKIDCRGYGLFFEDQQAVLGTLRQDCPEFYFLSGQCCTVGDEFWLCIDGEYAKAADRKALQTAIENAALQCDRYLHGGMNELELALTIHDYLTANVTYSYEADGVTPSDDVWAHNLVGWATKNLGVCETYAESYAYLCDLFGLECWTVTGKEMRSGVGHAWNILQLDGVWYNVDVTWDDGFEKSSPNIIDRKWFGMGATEFASTHVADLPTGVGGEYQVKLPNVSEDRLVPVLLKENDDEGKIIPSMDKAIASMKNEGSRYEVILYPDTNAQTAAGLTIYPQGASFTKKTLPKTSGLTISAKRYYVDQNSYIPAQLTAPMDVTLKGSTFLRGLTWLGGTIHADDGKLALAADAELQCNTLTGTLLEIDAGTSYATVSCEVQLAQLHVLSGGVYVYGATNVQFLQMEQDTSLYHMSADNVTIGSVISRNSKRLQLENKTLTSVMSIGGISAQDALEILVVFMGVEGYPLLRFTGAILGKLNLLLMGKVSVGGASITPSMMAVPVANVSSVTDIKNIAVYFVQGNTAYPKTYTKDVDGNLIAKE